MVLRGWGTARGLRQTVKIFESVDRIWDEVGANQATLARFLTSHLLSNPIRFRHDHHDCVLMTGSIMMAGAATVCAMLVYLFVVCRLLVPHPHMCHMAHAYKNQPIEQPIDPTYNWNLVQHGRHSKTLVLYRRQYRCFIPLQFTQRDHR